MFWNVRVIPPQAMRWDFKPLIVWPSNVTCPRVGAYTPVTTLNTVVLPTSSPGWMASEKSATALSPPNCMVMSSIASSGVEASPRPEGLSAWVIGNSSRCSWETLRAAHGATCFAARPRPRSQSNDSSRVPRRPCGRVIMSTISMSE